MVSRVVMERGVAGWNTRREKRLGEHNLLSKETILCSAKGQARDVDTGMEARKEGQETPVKNGGEGTSLREWRGGDKKTAKKSEY